MNKMNGLLLLLALFRLLQPIIVSAQSTAIVFETTIAPTPAQCACYAGIVCPSGTTGGVDIRIVNNGTLCPTGYVYCCTSGGGGGSSNIGINAATCGRVYVSPTAQPAGQASFGEFPWQVALYASPNVYVGGGALITSLHVLTATHKITSYLNGGLIARLGEWNFQVTTEPYPFREIPVASIAMYSPFNANNLQNDIAVLRLRDPAPIGPPNNPHINTVCLTSGLPAAGTRCRVTGWGKNAFNGQYQSILKMTDVPVVSSADCQTALRRTALGANFVLDGSFMCAGGEAGKDACTGDGGSALVCPTSSGAYQAVGLVSWGLKCADGGIPGVYTNIYNFDAWVKSQATV